MRLVEPAARAAKRSRGGRIGLVLLVSLALGAAACSAAPTASGPVATGGTGTATACDTSKKVKIGFSAPAADHGWLGAVITSAQATADKYKADVTFVTANGGADASAQGQNIRTLAGQGLDAIAILPYDGAALTPVAQELTNQGIKVVNIDREFSALTAFRTWIGGDNYGIGRQAGLFFVDKLKGKTPANVVEIEGIAGISVTDLRHQGFMDAIAGSNVKVVASQPADFDAAKGRTVMETILQANPAGTIQGVYTHDDDMAEGVVAAINNANRQTEMILTGAGGSKNAMTAIKAGGLYAATFLYNPTMAGSAVNLARLIAHGCGLSELNEPAVPQRIQLDATTVTKDNVDQYLALGY
jgi:ribose transport system substrate-binding protein